MHWVGPEGIILWANRAELQLLGYSRQEYIGRNIAEFHADQPVIEDILRQLTAGAVLTDYQARLVHKDGSIRDVLINSSVFSKGGEFIHTGCFTRDVTDSKRSDAQIAILAREAEHRSKNILATVQATVNLSKADTPEELKRVVSGRIQALANAHSMFAETRWEGADLRKLIQDELAAYLNHDEPQVVIDGCTVLLEPAAAQAVAVTVHELATNAAKYGSLSAPEGRVRVHCLRPASGRLILRWKEENGPPVKRPSRAGFGSLVMESIVRTQLLGEIIFDWQRDGLLCEISMPV
jgi:PAS domain S-box-containing protein